ncbi:MAG: hypothetical protein NXI18_15460 [Alphaproteobacteria bacterium]|nr:hypothetical protein [Alphaproteobacteria bacterium]
MRRPSLARWALRSFDGRLLDDVARALAGLLALASLGLATGVWLTGETVADLVARGERVLGSAFLVGLSLLLLLALLAAVRLWRDPEDRPWRATGLQAASGIATLALTFTLLGIGLGIASLSDSRIAPETVNAIIAALTERFALAFSTTVVGLPLAALMRAVLIVLAERKRPAGAPGVEG